MKPRLLHRSALVGERLLETMLGRAEGRKSRALDPYFGYATPDQLILRGRVLSRQHATDRRARGSRLGNFIGMASLFLTYEVEGVEIRHGDRTALTDEEGYFQLVLPRDGRAPGWHDACVEMDSGEKVDCPFFVAPETAPAMIISDIDDTVMKTGAWSLMRNLWTTFTGGLHTREVYNDAVALLRGLRASFDLPIYYVSSSPWNLHAFLVALFRRADLPLGPMFLRDLGIDRQKFITDGHGNHKGDSIDLLMAAHPGVPAILFGDTGQQDARIYLDAIRRHPGRVLAVILREPAPWKAAAKGADKAGALDDIESSGVPVFHGQDMAPFSHGLSALLAERSTPPARPELSPEGDGCPNERKRKDIPCKTRGL